MHGENAAKHVGREYWSPRAGRGTSLPWGRIGKWITHRKERAAARREEYKEMQRAIAGMDD